MPFGHGDAIWLAMETRFHPIGDGRCIAFRHTTGVGPAIVFLPGYMSDMAGTKAMALFAWAEANGRECLLLDYSGCGESSGDFAEGTLSRWAEEVATVIESEVAGAVILVGSSMGGWVMLLVGLALHRRLAGLVGIAAAPDFTEWGYDESQKVTLKSAKPVFTENAYGYEPTPTHASFWADGQAHRQLSGTIPLDCPVRLLHGQEDADVPPEISLRLAGALRSQDVQVTLVKGGDHRLSRDGDIALILRTIAALAESAS